MQPNLGFWPASFIFLSEIILRIPSLVLSLWQYSPKKIIDAVHILLIHKISDRWIWHKDCKFYFKRFLILISLVYFLKGRIMTLQNKNFLYSAPLDGFTIVHYPKSFDEDIILGRIESSAFKFHNLLLPSRFMS